MRRLLGLALCLAGCAGTASRDEGVWLQQLPVQSAVPPALLENLARAAGEGQWPAELREDLGERVLWVTTFGEAPRMGSGHGFQPALQMALQGLRPTQFVKVDLVSLSDNLLSKLQTGLDGVAFSDPPGLLPDQLSHRGLLRGGRLRKDYAARLGLQVGTETPRFRFRTQQAVWTPEKCFSLYRGHRLYSVAQLNRTLLLESACLAGDFLLRQLGPDGRFVYSYQAAEDRQQDGYNLLRHGGCCYALAQLSRASGRPEYARGAQRGLTYLLQQTRPSPSERLSLVERRQVKLGGNGLAVIALLEYQQVTGDRRWLGKALRLGRSVLAAQSGDGAFRVHKSDFSSGQKADFSSDYYPGEAILALVYLHRCQPAGPWLAAARRGADYLIRVRDKNLADLDLPHDHWLLLALSELQKERAQQHYGRHMARICKSIRATQLHGQAEPDWNGGFYDPPRLGPTSIRCEGMGAALAWLPAADQTLTREALLSGVVFQLQAQLRPESCTYFVHPERALGGIPRSLTSFELRIDYSQHFISAVLAAARLFPRAEGDASKP